jgi:transcriptional regulator with XRE-family HTH domain
VRNKSDLYDFLLLGQAIKQARKSKGLTREKFSEIIDLSPRYIMSIENKGQHPCLQKFYELVTMFNISVDEYFFPDTEENKTTNRRELDAILDS